MASSPVIPYEIFVMICKYSDGLPSILSLGLALPSIYPLLVNGLDAMLRNILGEEESMQLIPVLKTFIYANRYPRLEVPGKTFSEVLATHNDPLSTMRCLAALARSIAEMEQECLVRHLKWLKAACYQVPILIGTFRHENVANPVFSPEERLRVRFALWRISLVDSLVFASCERADHDRNRLQAARDYCSDLYDWELDEMRAICDIAEEVKKTQPTEKIIVWRTTKSMLEYLGQKDTGRLDKSPLSPKALAKKIVDRCHERNRMVTAKDPGSYPAVGWCFHVLQALHQRPSLPLTPVFLRMGLVFWDAARLIIYNFLPARYQDVDVANGIARSFLDSVDIVVYRDYREQTAHFCALGRHYLQVWQYLRAFGDMRAGDLADYVELGPFRSALIITQD